MIICMFRSNMSFRRHSSELPKLYGQFSPPQLLQTYTFHFHLDYFSILICVHFVCCMPSECMPVGSFSQVKLRLRTILRPFQQPTWNYWSAMSPLCRWTLISATRPDRQSGLDQHARLAVGRDSRPEVNTSRCQEGGAGSNTINSGSAWWSTSCISLHGVWLARS